MEWWVRMPFIWVEQLEISTKTALKIITNHQVHPTEVRSAVEGVEGLEFVWDDHQTRGRRAILKVSIRKRWWWIVLYPDRSGRRNYWHLGSAYEVNE